MSDLSVIMGKSKRKKTDPFELIPKDVFIKFLEETIGLPTNFKYIPDSTPTTGSDSTQQLAAVSSLVSELRAEQTLRLAELNNCALEAAKWRKISSDSQADTLQLKQENQLGLLTIDQLKNQVQNLQAQLVGAGKASAATVELQTRLAQTEASLASERADKLATQQNLAAEQTKTQNLEVFAAQSSNTLAKQLAQAAVEKQQLQAQLAAAQASVDRLTAEAASAGQQNKSEVEKLQIDLIQCRGELKSGIDRINAQNSQQAKFDADSAAYRQLITTQNEKLEKNVAQIGSLTLSLKQAQDEVTNLLARNQSVKDFNQNLQLQVEKFKEAALTMEQQSAKSSLENQQAQLAVKNLELQIARLTGDLDVCGQKLQESERKSALSQEQGNVSVANVQVLELELNNARERLREIDTNQNSIISLQTDLQQSRDANQNLTEQLASLEQTCTKTTADAQTLQTQINSLRERATNDGKELALRQNQIATLDATARRATALLQKQTALSTQQAQQIEEAKKSLDECQASQLTVSRQLEELKALGKQSIEQSSVISSLQTTNDGLTQQLSSCNKNITSCSQTLAELQNELTASNASLAELEKSSSQFELNNKLLQNRVGQLEGFEKSASDLQTQLSQVEQELETSSQNVVACAEYGQNLAQDFNAAQARLAASEEERQKLVEQLNFYFSEKQRLDIVEQQLAAEKEQVRQITQLLEAFQK